MNPDDNDPFLQVQADILATLNTTRPLFSSYQRIRSLATKPNNPELLQAREELESTLHELSTDLEDLVDSVRVVENDPYRYGIELDEVERRRRLVEDVGREIEGMREELQKTVASNAATAGREAGGGGGGALPNPSDFDHLLDEDRDEDYYAELEHQRQLEMMQEQDQQLDGVFRTVGNLRQQADDMGRELEEQAEILKDVDTLADRVGGKLQSGVRRVGHIIRRNEDTMSSCCIAILIMVLILLLILVIVL
ncbi:SNARE domain containing protein [Coccidioides posadasii C735 delta SOWgp]|uniref:t-SNARE affecting a late Golgi compartment protein 1 n=1 Tax=Coccidioides posadasii (strain C735) TaxID=222929 RepID=C5P4J9_COCP7|nr:SNARE domain containing protein [Coccidioides posadasii C735 delta SOWgp]EER27639.1 SNARE domain containing protein [Coccidioides posadasii C735 delta SOWgp]|eukprot:XP_003069784.1 SNARE domain containing protein [Coccidioides posadasii C735 delta SOWgp]